MGFAYQIDIFTTKDRPIDTRGYEATFCLLDEILRIQKGLSKFSQNSDAIKTFAIENEETLIEAFQCQNQASFYGLKKLPAVVIDKRFVAYGKLSVAHAIDILEKKKAFYD